MNSLNQFGDFLEKMLSQFKSEIYKNAPFDRSKKGRIVTAISPQKYKVEIGGKQYTVSSSIECAVNDFVWVTIPCGNEQAMFIATKSR